MGTPPGGGTAQNRVVSERDSKRIVRQWNREIEDEIRRERARHEREFPWKSVVWAALWLLWLALLMALLAGVRSLL
jgi:hypothetical protein